MAELDEGFEKKRSFRKFTYGGVDFDQLDMPNNNFAELMLALIKKLRMIDICIDDPLNVC